MYYGITINGTNTLTAFGLALADDLVIGAAPIKRNYVDIPAIDGELNLSEVGGRARYGMRQITGTLVSVTAKDPSEMAAAARSLKEYSGQTVRINLPDDTGHYFKGMLEVGDEAGYNANTIAFSVTAWPWRLKNAETSVTVTIGSSLSASKTLTNEGAPATPVFRASGAAMISYGGHTHPIAPNTDMSFDDIIFAKKGSYQLGFSASASGTTVTVKYQEGVL